MNTLILFKEDRVLFESSDRGLRPLLTCIGMFKGKVDGCTLNDKVIGLAAARLIVYSGFIAHAITPVASNKAIKLLREHGIRIDAENSVDMILNNSKDGQCPMESRAEALSNAQFYESLNATAKY